MAQAPVRRFPLVQVLRASAALSVAWTHILHDALALSPHTVPLRRLHDGLPWDAGVDVFFVISGFIIVHASGRLFAAPGAPRIFAFRRLARIVPLYWLMTTFFLIEAACSPGTIHGALGGAGYILKSYLFIPAARPDGVVQPALGLGWTLNDEMFFYAVFTPFLALPRVPAVLGAIGGLLGLVVAGQVGLLHGVILRSWANPIILEFCAGMMLALTLDGILLRPPLRLGLVLGALALLIWHPDGPRIVCNGIPAVALLLAAISGPAAGRLPRAELWMIRLGDASYALYLVHPFVMRGIALLWRQLAGSASIYGYIVICLALAQLAALALHLMFEQPVGRRLRAWSAPAQAAPARLVAR
jgi:peptidoglycan/LPS O-acetylase OafA/YrhL